MRHLDKLISRLKRYPAVSGYIKQVIFMGPTLQLKRELTATDTATAPPLLPAVKVVKFIRVTILEEKHYLTTKPSFEVDHIVCKRGHSRAANSRHLINPEPDLGFAQVMRLFPLVRRLQMVKVGVLARDSLSMMPSLALSSLSLLSFTSRPLSYATPLADLLKEKLAIQNLRSLKMDLCDLSETMVLGTLFQNLRDTLESIHTLISGFRHGVKGEYR